MTFRDGDENNIYAIIFNIVDHDGCNMMNDELRERHCGFKQYIFANMPHNLSELEHIAGAYMDSILDNKDDRFISTSDILKSDTKYYDKQLSSKYNAIVSIDNLPINSTFNSIIIFRFLDNNYEDVQIIAHYSLQLPEYVTTVGKTLSISLE